MYYINFIVQLVRKFCGYFGGSGGGGSGGKGAFFALLCSTWYLRGKQICVCILSFCDSVLFHKNQTSILWLYLDVFCDSCLCEALLYNEQKFTSYLYID